MDSDSLTDSFTDIAYRVRGRLFGARPGRHRSRVSGAGGAFTGLVPLLDRPDPRRIDLRASARDPFGTLWVRDVEQSVDARVILLVDFSGSMGVVGRASRADLARALCIGLATAVERSGDRFGLILAGEHVYPDSLLPALRRRGVAATVAALTAAVEPHGAGAAGLLEAVELLPAARSIVLLLSDFTFPRDQLDLVLDKLATHDVRPILLRDSAIDAPSPAFGLVTLYDLETRRRRLMLMRPSVAERWRAAADEQRQAVRRTLIEHGLAPIEITDQIDVDALFDALGDQGGAA